MLDEENFASTTGLQPRTLVFLVFLFTHATQYTHSSQFFKDLLPRFGQHPKLGPIRAATQCHETPLPILGSPRLDGAIQSHGYATTSGAHPLTLKRYSDTELRDHELPPLRPVRHLQHRVRESHVDDEALRLGGT